MATTNKPIYFGEFMGICQVCFSDSDRFGMLVDPNGHTWLVCFMCISALWADRQAINQERRADDIRPLDDSDYS